MKVDSWTGLRKQEWPRIKKRWWWYREESGEAKDSGSSKLGGISRESLSTSARYEMALANDVEWFWLAEPDPSAERARLFSQSPEQHRNTVGYFILHSYKRDSCRVLQLWPHPRTAQHFILHSYIWNYCFTIRASVLHCSGQDLN